MVLFLFCSSCDGERRVLDLRGRKRGRMFGSYSYVGRGARVRVLVNVRVNASINVRRGREPNSVFRVTPGTLETFGCTLFAKFYFRPHRDRRSEHAKARHEPWYGIPFDPRITTIPKCQVKSSGPRLNDLLFHVKVGQGRVTTINFMDQYRQTCLLGNFNFRFNNQ